jgi:anti-anti-sigma factor
LNQITKFKPENAINLVPKHYILDLPARLDGSNSPDFESQLTSEQLSSVQYLILNFQSVNMITSIGIRYLIVAAQQMRQRGGCLLLCGTGDTVQQVLKISGLLKQFQILRDVDAAVLWLSENGTPEQ